MAEPSGSGNQDDQGAKRNGRRKKKHHLGIRYLPDNSDDSSESQDLSSASHEVSSVYRTISLGASPTGEIPPEAASSSHHDVVEMEEGSLPPPARFGRSPSDVLGVSPMSMAASPSLYLMPELGESPSDLMIQQQQQMEMMSSSSSIPGSIKDSQTSSHSEITVSTMSSSMSTSDLPELPFDSPKRLPPVPLVVGGEKTSPQHHKAGPSKGGGGEKKSPHKKGQAKTTPSGDIEMEDFRSEGTSSPMAVDDEDPEVVLTEEEKRKKEAAAKKKKEKRGFFPFVRKMGMKVKCLDPGSTSSDKIGLLGNLKPERGYPGGGSKKYTPSRDSEKDSGDESIVGARGGNPETEKDATTEKQQELIFHNDYGAVTNCTIDLKLRSFDLCNILCGKFGVKKDHNGTLVEHWVDKGLERIIEDHEDVLSVWRQTEKGAKKLIFRKNPLRYAIFVSPEDYFPSDMVDLGRDIESPTPPEVLVYTNDCPLIFSQVDLRKEFDKTIWVRTFLVLKNRQLLMSLNVHAVSTFLKQWKTRKIRYTPLDEPDPNKDKDDSCLHFLADLKDYEIYNCLNAKNQLRAPTEFGICLRRTSEDDFASSIVFSCDNSDDRTCWLAAMRLSKYGKQLKQNYKEFREKSRAIYDEEMRRMGSSSGKAGQSESRVAMDFTGATGRIVEDQLEAEEIAVADASGSGGRHRMRSTAAAAAVAAVVASAVTSGSATYSSDFELIDKKHANKPWYHKNMSREQASRALLDFSTEDGTFVVRDSRSQPGCHVLSIRLHDKIVHVRVYPMIDSVTWDSCYSLDNGHTKFQCLVKLVEFYRLNQGSLPCRLTYHLEKVPEESTDV